FHVPGVQTCALPITQNDFSNWIQYVFESPKIANRIRTAPKEETIAILQSAIAPKPATQLSERSAKKAIVAVKEQDKTKALATQRSEERGVGNNGTEK